MGFTFKRPEDQLIRVTGQSEGQPIAFVGRFKTTATGADRDALSRRINDALATQDRTVFSHELQAIAAEIFLGWVNRPEDDRSEWVTDEAGQLIEATPEQVRAMLAFPGVAMAIVSAFNEQEFSREALVGNSKPSGGNGFRVEAARAAPKS